MADNKLLSKPKITSFACTAVELDIMRHEIEYRIYIVEIYKICEKN